MLSQTKMAPSIVWLVVIVSVSGANLNKGGEFTEAGEFLMANIEAGPPIFDGVWYGTFDEFSRTIEGDKIRWDKPGGPTATVTFDGNVVTLDLDGTVYTGELTLGLIVWSDGDIWTRQGQPNFYGKWYGTLDKFSRTVGLDKITWDENGSTGKATFNGNVITLIFGGEQYTGELTPEGLIVWSDGDIWTRPGKPNFYGKWYGTLDEFSRTVGLDKITWDKDGSTGTYTLDGNVINLLLNGNQYRGELNSKGEIIWSDDDKWTRKR